MNKGKVSENIFKRSILREINVNNNDVITGAAFGEDCAILNCNGLLLVSQATDSGVSGGRPALIRAVNNLAAGGAEFTFANAVLLFPTDIEEEEIRKTQRGLIETAEELGGTIVGGQTEVSDKVRETIVTVTVYGSKITDNKLSKRNIKSGDSIIATKYIGLEGGYILYEKVKDRLLKGFEADFTERLSLYKDMLSVSKEGRIGAEFGVTAMKDVSENGIFGALRELGEATGRGLRVNLKDIPVRQELIEVCNYLNINPYMMRSAGMMLMVSDRPEELLEKLVAEGIAAVKIGNFTDEQAKIVVNEDEERFLDKIKQDEIYSII